jgi:serine/threonine protein kinase
LKLFDEDEDDGTLDKCTLREVSMMRCLRGSKNGHPGVLDIHDIVVTEEKMCLVMEKFACNVNDAIEKKLFKSPKGRVRFSHKLLSAVAFLHDNGIMHRDIKGDNIMLTKSGDPVLIDFSLAKFVTDAEIDTTKESKKKSSFSIARKHTSDSGSATYMAPEVYFQEPYCEKCDMYSVGIVLLEIVRGENLPVDRDKAAFKYVIVLSLSLSSLKFFPETTLDFIITGTFKTSKRNFRNVRFRM